MVSTDERMQQGIRKLAAFSAAMRAMSEGAQATTGRSPDGSVTVQVDAAGAATAVDLADTWRRRLEGPLGPAVVAAYQDARRGQVVGGLERIAALPARLDDVPVTDSDLAAATPAPVDLAELQRSQPSLREVHAQLDQALAQARDVGAAGTTAAAAPTLPGREDVEVLLDAAGGISACGVSESWQRQAPLERLLEALNRPLLERGADE